MPTLSKEQRESYEQEIRNLQCDLTSSTSPIGDWKLAKAQEYAMFKREIPYDMADYHSKREAVRARINELQSLLESESKGGSL